MAATRPTNDLLQPPTHDEALPDLPLTTPSIPDMERLASDFAAIMGSGVLTNGPFVRKLEGAAADKLGVRHCVAVASCTAGLMLVLRAADLSGDVIVPSFTFAATAHAVVWNGLRPVFADVDEGTFTLSQSAVERILGVRTSAILATHLYGTPCDIEGLTELAQGHGIRLFFDAAHAFGSLHGGDPVGRFGDAEVFSLSPTKVLTACEGGIISTNDDQIAERCRIGRDYANPGDYNCLFVGLNARMSEIHAAVALASLDGLEDRVRRRNSLAARYRKALQQVPGLGFVSVPDGDRSTFKDFTIKVDGQTFGLNATALARTLEAVGIQTRRYYDPPVHAMHAYRSLGIRGSLRVTEASAPQVLSLPMWSEMPDDAVDRVADAIKRIHEHVAGDGVA
jgi:dTDP-4-amino-4,6-dideoxygalactose transaminase